MRFERTHSPVRPVDRGLRRVAAADRNGALNHSRLVCQGLGEALMLACVGDLGKGFVGVEPGGFERIFVGLRGGADDGRNGGAGALAAAGVCYLQFGAPWRYPRVVFDGGTRTCHGACASMFSLSCRPNVLRVVRRPRGVASAAAMLEPLVQLAPPHAAGFGLGSLTATR